MWGSGKQFVRSVRSRRRWLAARVQNCNKSNRLAWKCMFTSCKQLKLKCGNIWTTELCCYFSGCCNRSEGFGQHSISIYVIKCPSSGSVQQLTVAISFHSCLDLFKSYDLQKFLKLVICHFDDPQRFRTACHPWLLHTIACHWLELCEDCRHSHD